MTDGKENIKKTSTWIRFAYMVLFGAILIPLGRFVLAFIVVGQFLMVLVKGRDNANLRKLGNASGHWIYQGILFLTFNSEAKPFPFDEWPDVELTPGYTSDQESGSEIVESDSESDDSDIPSFVSSDGEALKDGDGKDLPKTDA
jgi:hypothetical protein